MVTYVCIYKCLHIPLKPMHATYTTGAADIKFGNLSAKKLTNIQFGGLAKDCQRCVLPQCLLKNSMDGDLNLAINENLPS